MNVSVRIIAGRWRRRRLRVPDAAGVRPTPDRVRETVFAWLAPVLPGARCLDLFAGTGSLGFEAASRGAAEVVLVERDRRLAAALRRHRDLLGAGAVVRVEEAEAMAWLRGARGRFDVVFLDPPFGSDLLLTAAGRLAARGLVAPGARVYLESERPLEEGALPPGWRLARQRRAGRVRYHLAAVEAAGDARLEAAAAGRPAAPAAENPERRP